MTYIDYGNSEDVLEGDIVGDVGEIPDTDYIDQFVKIKDPAHLVFKTNDAEWCSLFSFQRNLLIQAVKVSVRSSTKTKIWWRIFSEQLWPP